MVLHTSVTIREGPSFNVTVRNIREKARISLNIIRCTKCTRFPLNSYVRIPFDVNSGLRPSISRLKDGAPLDRNARVRVLFNNTLAIDRAQPEDGGNYVCRASNGYNEAEDRVDITVEDLQVQDSCVDNPYFANCKLIVKARYCGNKYYAKFCCRSCTLAGEAVTETKL